MKSRNKWFRSVLAGPVIAFCLCGGGLMHAGDTNDPTFSRDIVPLLQRSCQSCHRPNGVAPMSLVTYEEVRPWARAIKMRTSLGPKAGVMPPWYIEKNIGIQRYKDDTSFSADEIQRIGRWVDAGAPRGNLSDMPPPLQFGDERTWRIGKPDLVVRTPEILVKANNADWWGEGDELIPIEGLAEDRYVAALEIKELNDVGSRNDGRQTVGGRYVVHHMSWSTAVTSTDGRNAEDGVTAWPVHEVGRNPDYFDPKGARLLRAGSSIKIMTLHLHSNGADTKARLEIGFKFLPKDYRPEYKTSRISLGNGMDIDVQPNERNQTLHAYAVLDEPTKIVTFEPHLHAPGSRMCLEAIWGMNIQTLTCAGYDHNWVRGYAYQDDYAPLLPRGTILHVIGFMDTTSANKNVSDTRNWSGSGNRSVANMFIDLGMRLSLTDEQFTAAMEERRRRLDLTANDVQLGCPLCNATPKPGYRRPARNAAQQ